MEVLAKEWLVFKSVAEHRSLSKAAEELKLPQSSITKYLQKLEYELKQKLFIRNNRGALLTEFGQDLYSSLKGISKVWSFQFDHSILKTETVSGTVTLGFHRVLALTYWPELYSSFQSQYPDLNFKVQFQNSTDVCRLVALGGLDYGLVADPGDFPGLVVRPCFKNKVAVYGGKTLKNLHEVQKIFYNPEMLQISKILRKLDGSKLEAIGDYDLAARLAVSSKQAAILPDTTAQFYGLNQELSPVFYKTAISWIYTSDRPKSKRHRAICDLIQLKSRGF